jgi:hypothetical protein
VQEDDVTLLLVRKSTPAVADRREEPATAAEDCAPVVARPGVAGLPP